MRSVRAATPWMSAPPCGMSPNSPTETTSGMHSSRTGNATTAANEDTRSRNANGRNQSVESVAATILRCSTQTPRSDIPSRPVSAISSHASRRREPNRRRLLPKRRRKRRLSSLSAARKPQRSAETRFPSPTATSTFDGWRTTAPSRTRRLPPTRSGAWPHDS